MHRDLVVIGCSAGCIEALGKTVLPALPNDFPAAVFVVIHTHPESPGMIPEILQRKCKLPVCYAGNGAISSSGHIYVAPPDRHLSLRDSRMVVSRGPRENRHRPAIDPLFRSAATAYGKQVIGVLLTGCLDDGSNGLMAIKEAGGITVVQDPEDTDFPGMVTNALRQVAVDYCLPLSKIVSLLTKLTSEEINDIGEEVMNPESEAGKVTGIFSCPECGGPVRETNGDRSPYYRCRVGHAYSLESMAQAQDDAVESSLWAAVQSLRQQADVRRRLAQQAEKGGRQHSAQDFLAGAEQAEKHAETIKALLMNMGTR
jgi:two-component system, chemotaxis family, protein-glutamate methylesterase/glutaminase